MRITASAPGKVVLLGEYAVLEGAPALVMAVNRRARVTLGTREDRQCRVAAPGWGAGAAVFELAPDGVAWSPGDAAGFDLPRHVIQAYFERRGVPLGGPGLDLELDSSALMAAGTRTPVKLGLGSSAALTVALCRALDCYAAPPDPGAAPDLATLVEIHSGFQNRRGSGLDVAASLHGGLIEYRRVAAPRAHPTLLPPDMGYCFVWSGRQAATGGFLGGIDQWRIHAEEDYRRHLAALSELSEAGSRAVSEGKAEELLRVIRAYVPALSALGNAAGVDIVSAPHRRLAALAERAGVAYKPCGAGGGDIGVALSREPGALARFRAALAPERFESLPLELEQSGATIQSGAG